ncbi:MAG: DUF2069 domain-containing protein [Halothiobacillaceae bacterium]|nr:DUF2069 domain-containing protein [Halothiobacillaceae bacterium]HER34887.1 DUF2069 domain-containing protein [Halothiobacillaceae bacterium]
MRRRTTLDGLPLWPLRAMALCFTAIIAGYLMITLGGDADIRPATATTVLLLLPAVAVLPGLWQGHYKTMVWAALLALFYLLVSSTDAWTVPADRGWHLMVAIAAITGFLLAWGHSIRRRRTLKRRAREGATPKPRSRHASTTATKEDPR